MRSHDHGEVSGQLMALINLLQETRQGRQGWCYAAINDDGTLLKLGGTKNCPICRVQGLQRVPGLNKRVRMNLIALAWSEDWKIHEQHLLRIDTPIFGDEWFQPGPHYKCQKSLVEYLCHEGWLNDVRDVTLQLSQMIAAQWASDLEETCRSTT